MAGGAERVTAGPPTKDDKETTLSGLLGLVVRGTVAQTAVKVRYTEARTKH